MINKVLVAGTFDILHPGHIFLINEAAKLGDVYVIVARDNNREKFSGKMPIIPEEQRLEVIKNLKNVKEAKLGNRDNNILLTVAEINPDFILLGPDQKIDMKFLRKTLKKKGLEHIQVKRLSKYYDKYELNSSSLIKRKISEFENQNEKKLTEIISSSISHGKV